MEPRRLTSEQQAVVEANHDLIDRLACRFALRYHLDQDDCQQAAALRACEAIVDYDPDRGELDHYLSTACWNALVAFAISWRRRPQLAIFELGDRAESVPERYRDPVHDLQLDLADALAKLDFKEQYVIIHGLFGLPINQIAKNLGCSRQNVWLIEQQATEKLRRLLKGYGKK